MGAVNDEVTAATHDAAEQQQREGRQQLDGEHQRAVHPCEGAAGGGIGPTVRVDEHELS